MEPKNNPKSGDVAMNSQLYNIEKIQLNIKDLREETKRSFDLNKFISVIELLRKNDLYDICMQFQYSDYGKFMSVFASAESDNWDEAIKRAIAIEIKLTNPPDRGLVYKGKLHFRGGWTDVEIRILMDKNEGRVFNFHFDEKGKYAGCGWKDIRPQDNLIDSDSGTILEG